MNTLNCRRVNSLLSAFVDAELTSEEMGFVTRHLAVCASCARECESLRQTKSLVASLALKAPRAELAALLLTEAQHTRNAGPLARLFPGWVGLWSDGYSGQATRAGSRLRPLTATVMLSVAGLWLASTQVDGPTNLQVFAPVSTLEPMSGMAFAARTLSIPPTLTGGVGSSGTPGIAGMAAMAGMPTRFSVTVARWHSPDGSVVSVASVPSRGSCVVSQVFPAQNAVPTRFVAPVQVERAYIVPTASQPVRYSVPVSAYPPVQVLPVTPPMYRVYPTEQSGYNHDRTYPPAAYSVYSVPTAH